ncbi:D-alanyl-D-alanine carboxypeptidase family protein [Promicromonospora sp. NPDC023987]|uniref:D-alanyl-D-alanine carboxypeptidase family protein n=1 Tax=Promicromonospora sp. NPDC023987 TaxID=3155360 RepID=UPI0033F942D5
MNDQAKKLVPQNFRSGLRKLLRPAWTGVVATVIAAGVLFTASASVPASHPSGGNDGELPIRLYGLIKSVAVGETDTAPDGVTLSQIVAVLERAEEQAQEQGPDFSPTVAQAAAELGMLYTTYQMQQLAFGENNEGLRIEDAPVARHAQEAGDDADDSDKEDDGEKHDAEKRDGDGADAKDGTSKKNADPERDDVEKDAEKDADPDRDPDDDRSPAVQVSNERTSVIDPHDDDPQAGYITYDEVVIAAVRLANMLDPSVPNALVEVQGGGQEAGRHRGFSLRDDLLDVVSRFGGTTTGYANGRIPADVLCPLDFAPGHMLRCDAAERFTALNEQFEQEFGYPIPITDSYRSYELQVAVASAKPHLAAIPGTSNHGWGLAVDLGNPIAGGNSPEYVWLRLNGPDYGWENPSWAQLGGSKPEPWHFEFFAAGSIPNRAIDPSDVGTWEPTDSASPRYKPALDPKPKDNSSDDGPRKPGDRPSDNPPSQKPTKPNPKPDGDKPDGDKPDKPTEPSPDPEPSNPTDPEPDPEPSNPTDPEPEPSNPTEPEPEPEPSNPTEPEPEPSNPTDPEPEPSNPTDPEPTDPGTEEPGTEEPTCPSSDGTESDGTESDGADSAAADDSAAEADTKSETEEPDPCASDGTDGDPEPSAAPSSSPTATVRDDELAPVDDQPEE